MKIQTTKIFNEFNSFINSNKRFGVWQGGSRSSKTYNIVLGWIMLLNQSENKVLTICRSTMPSLKNTVFRDFIEWLIKLNLYNPDNLNKGDMTYKIGTNIVEFRNLDDEFKVRGAKRDYLYINEANEISYPIYKQLNMRTKDKVVLDYNPSDEFHWIYDKVLIDIDCVFHKSTYLDNPFLPLAQVKEIEKYKITDPNYWKVYGLGERGLSEATIYRRWELTDEEKPQGYNSYGLDFGFNDPNALIDMVIVDCEEPYIWLDELIYKNELTTPELIKDMKKHNISRNSNIFGDNSRPETIQEISNYKEDGKILFNIKPCIKGKGSVKSGIDWIKRYNVKITKRSLNLIKEIKSYKWKVDKDERILDEPVDLNNHGLDAVRYSLSEKVESLIPQKIEVYSDFEI